MKPIDFSYFIERYNAGEMSTTEREWFRKELNGNDQLRAEVNLRKRTDDVLRSQDILNLRNKLSGIEKRRETVSVTKKAKKPAYHKYAAIMAILVLLGVTAMFFLGNKSTEESLDQYYNAYEPPSNQRSGMTEENADFTLALEFYNTHDYENAAFFFNKVLISNPRDMQSVLLKGVSNFEDQKYPEAKLSFVKVINEDNNLFIETAKWYLALCYIETNEREKAIQQLTVINNEGGIYRNAAKKLMRKLK